MGDIADAVLNGDFCQHCGEYLGEGAGFPRTCQGCRRDEGERRHRQKRNKSKRHRRSDGRSTDGR